MKHFIIFSLAQLLIFLSPFSHVLAAEPQAERSLEQRIYARNYDNGETLGRQVADSSRVASGWFTGGLFGGLLLGPVGTATVAIISQNTRPAVPSHYATPIKDQEPAYQEGFVDGYTSVMQRKALTKSIVAGTIGTAVLGIVVVAVIAASLGSMNMDMSSGSY